MKKTDTSSADLSWWMYVLGGIWIIVEKPIPFDSLSNFSAGVGFMISGFSFLLIKVGVKKKLNSIIIIGKTFLIIGLISFILTFVLPFRKL